jgi:hypothetical protein
MRIAVHVAGRGIRGSERQVAWRVREEPAPARTVDLAEALPTAPVDRHPAVAVAIPARLPGRSPRAAPACSPG